jgi:trk system potassium uptake protein TrkA
MKIIILGCGRVGSRLATLMEQDGHDVSIIDADPRAFDRLPETFSGQTVLGTGIDVDVLKSAGIENADAFAAVTNFDNTNIMACEVAKEIFGVKQVLARIYDPGRESFYHELGLETVCPTTLVSTAAYSLLSPDQAFQPQFHTAPLSQHEAESLGGSEPAAVAAAAVPATQAAAQGQLTGTSGQASETPVPGQPQAEPSKQQNGRGGLRGLFRP